MHGGMTSVGESRGGISAAPDTERDPKVQTQQIFQAAGVCTVYVKHLPFISINSATQKLCKTF